jgi:hypothetical protein
MTDSPPSAVTSADIRRFLLDAIAAGTLPEGDEFIYVVYYPATTTVQLYANDGGCAAGYGYHDAVDTTQHRFAYAAIPNCSAYDPQARYEDILFPDASHEIIEAATNPFPVDDPAYWLGNPLDPWSQAGGEVADACAGLTTEEGGYSLTRVYSNSAASRGDDPCQPGDGETYYGVSPADRVYAAQPGETLTIPLFAWATGPIASWNVKAYRGFVSAFAPHPTLSASTASAGDQLVLTVTVPTTARHGDVGSVILGSFAQSPDPVPYSLFLFPQFDWPLLIQVR